MGWPTTGILASPFLHLPSLTHSFRGQSCGYPLHLRISTKESLNELARRFPERPPHISWSCYVEEDFGGWKEGICTESRILGKLGAVEV